MVWLLVLLHLALEVILYNHGYSPESNFLSARLCKLYHLKWNNFRIKANSSSRMFNCGHSVFFKDGGNCQFHFTPASPMDSGNFQAWQEQFTWTNIHRTEVLVSISSCIQIYLYVSFWILASVQLTVFYSRRFHFLSLSLWSSSTCYYVEVKLQKLFYRINAEFLILKILVLNILFMWLQNTKKPHQKHLE